ncbi:hypothetical protein C8F01DRAFT_718688 [Mycena amicta]|nr:hypothetical protein C8F01DRAFT_718688 [Mycena amicta]
MGVTGLPTFLLEHGISTVGSVIRCGVVLVAHACLWGFTTILCFPYLASAGSLPTEPPPPTLNPELAYDIPTLNVFHVLYPRSAIPVVCVSWMPPVPETTGRLFPRRYRRVRGHTGRGAGLSNVDTQGVGGPDLVLGFSPTFDSASLLSIVIGSFRPSRAQSARARCPPFIQPRAGVQTYASVLAETVHDISATSFPSDGRSCCVGGEGFKAGCRQALGDYGRLTQTLPTGFEPDFPQFNSVDNDLCSTEECPPPDLRKSRGTMTSRQTVTRTSEFVSLSCSASSRLFSILRFQSKLVHCIVLKARRSNGVGSAVDGWMGALHGVSEGPITGVGHTGRALQQRY